MAIGRRLLRHADTPHCIVSDNNIKWMAESTPAVVRQESISKPRGGVNPVEGNRGAVHVWIFAEKTQQLLLRRHGQSDDGKWDVSSAGYVSATSSSLVTARKKLHEEMGISLPKEAFELLFVSLQSARIDGESVKNDVSLDVYLITTPDTIPLEALNLTLEEGKVSSSVKYVSYGEYRSLLAKEDPGYVSYDVNGQYGQLFDIIKKRYTQDTAARSLTLQKQLSRYASDSLTAELSGLSNGDKEALGLLIKAAKIIDDLFYHQVWYNNPALKDWLKENADASELDKLKWAYYSINKTPWSALDENEAFLSTADSSIILLPEATKRVHGWKGLEYKAAFPLQKPPGANFYPPDMDKKEFESWKESLNEKQRQEADGFFTVVRRKSELKLDSSPVNLTVDDKNDLVGAPVLYGVPYSQEYSSFLYKAADLLHLAGNLATTPSLKRLLHSKADAFLSNDYYESDIAWMELDSKLDVTVGPYETYEDALFGYKATFEVFIGVRDDNTTAQLKLFGDNLQVLEQNLPIENAYKSKDVSAAPIRVIDLVYAAGDVKGPLIVAFNLPNDERIVKERGTSMVMIKNLQEAKFNKILQPIADVCICEEQKELVDFDSFFTHIVCHECVHGIGPHTITLPSGQTSTVRKELQELHSTLEEAKADIVGLWALKFLIDKDLLSESFLKTMYVSFLAASFRAVRFGLEEAHGKGQAIQFNWLFEKEAVILRPDETFSVDFAKVEGAVESLSSVILTIQAKGDKAAAQLLVDKYCKITPPLQLALAKLEKVQVPVDIAASFPIANEIAN
ncbi:Nudix hydrolase 3 [Turnera subulata]|uniref:Nudix hydrolase 3 n=1 Tax=Turnera subulata TaxID=218843 RepID=A0A9Q0FIA4_9ROSI|nr:Nudix hydrolase 3 [Turnera subulata]